MSRINLKKFIAEHYKSGITARDVIREAVTNSIHAGARDITVDLVFSEKNMELIKGGERKVLEQILIIDDGEGFTAENLDCFDEICTDHKDDIGGKGVGRLAFLKYANRVEIRSQLANEVVQFVYTPDFKPEDIERLNAKGTPSTCVSLSDLKDRINTQVRNLVNSICDDVRLMLFLRKQQGQSINIHFKHNSQQPFQENFCFAGEDIVALQQKEFDLDGEKFECYLFQDLPPARGIVAILCADNICIEEFYISKRFDVCKYSIFVTSDYFNNRSNIERQQLIIPRTDEESDFVSPISRERLMPHIQEECVAMINKYSDGDIEEFKSNNIEKLRKHYPYINISSLGGNAAMLDADEIVKTYRIQQARQEDSVVESLEAGKPVSWDDVSHLASADLARYIVHRALVIDSLEKIPANSAEIVIHNAILPKKSDGSEIRENNVWLVDDKFLSYSSIYSDEALAKIIRQVNSEVESKQRRQPDIAVFFSRDSENQPNKLVIIEFKKPGADIFENSKSLTQCRVYASNLTDSIPTVLEVFAFAIVDIDDEFYRELKQTNYKDVFSLNERVVYNDFKIGKNDSIPLHQYVMPVSALLKDAKARNRVFEEVLQFDVQDRIKTNN